MFTVLLMLRAHAVQKYNRYIRCSIFEKWNRTVESNRSANEVRKKRLPSYTLLLPPGPQTLLFTFYALDISSPKMKSLR